MYIFTVKSDKRTDGINILEFVPKAVADLVCLDSVQIQISIKNGFIINAEARNHAKTPELLLELLFFFLKLAFFSFGGVYHEYVKNIAFIIVLGKVAIIFEPAYFAAFLNDPVLHVIHIVIVAGDLFADTAFHSLYIFGMNKPAKGIAGNLPKFFHCLAVKNF